MASGGNYGSTNPNRPSAWESGFPPRRPVSADYIENPGSLEFASMRRSERDTLARQVAETSRDMSEYRRAIKERKEREQREQREASSGGRTRAQKQRGERVLDSLEKDQRSGNMEGPRKQEGKRGLKRKFGEARVKDNGVTNGESSTTTLYERFSTVSRTETPESRNTTESTPESTNQVKQAPQGGKRGVKRKNDGTEARNNGVTKSEASMTVLNEKLASVNRMRKSESRSAAESTKKLDQPPQTRDQKVSPWKGWVEVTEDQWKDVVPGSEAAVDLEQYGRGKRRRGVTPRDGSPEPENIASGVQGRGAEKRKRVEDSDRKSPTSNDDGTDEELGPSKRRRVQFKREGGRK